MYSTHFAVAIKAGGKILRENKDLVQLPFGSEFTVLVKNLNSRRAKFTLHIDGTDALGGEEIIVNANSEVEMKRFIRNGNMDAGNAFKFIERTTAIEDGPRGIKMDDGIVRVQFWFEKQPDETITTTHYHKDVWLNDWYKRRDFYPHIGSPYYGVNNAVADIASGSGILRSMSASVNNVATAQNVSLSSNSVKLGNVAPSYDASAIAKDFNEAGITVPGSKVDQKFTPVYGFVAEAQSNVIIIRLAGKVGEVAVSAPVIARAKQKCSTCSHMNKANAKFCSECGTALDLL